MEIVNAQSTNMEDDNAENIARKVHKTLKSNFKQENGTLQSLLSVAAEGDSINDFVRHAFGVAYNVRRGYMSVSTPGNAESGMEASASLLLETANPTDLTPGPSSAINSDSVQRNHTIVSFSAKFIRELMQSKSSGDTN